MPPSDNLIIRVKRLPHAEGLPLPEYATAGSAGVDLAAAVADDLEILPGDRALIPTGLILAIPTGYEGQVRPRSGLAWKHGITLLNSPGTIDSDYRGEVKVLIHNAGKEAFTISRGMRIAQLVFAPVHTAVLEEIETLDETLRSSGGFGHTG